jgi:hypothetical protein
MKQNDDVSSTDDLGTDSCEKALELLSFIPKEVDKMELLQQLQPICGILSALPEHTAEVFFREKIQSRFGLTNLECGGYMRAIARLRKARVKHSKEEHFKYSADFDGLIDLVDCDGECAFLIKENDNLIVRKEAWVKGARLIPPPKQNIPWLLPRASEVLKYFEQYRTDSHEKIDSLLYDDLVTYYQKCSQLPSSEAYHMLALWTFHTYMLEAAQYSPFMSFCGPPEKGKTRTGKAMVYVARHGIHMQSPNEAQLIRLARDWKATIFCDAADFVARADQQRTRDCMLLRYERGAAAFKVSRPWLEAHDDMKLYNVFGATIIASNQELDELFETRSLVFHMPSADKSFERDVTPEMALALKERLVCFRAVHHGQILPKIIKPAEGRLGDLTRPLEQMRQLVKPKEFMMLMDFVWEQESARKFEKGESPDARLIRAVCESVSKVCNGCLSIQTICTRLNEGKSDSSRLKPAWVGRRLRALGFGKTRIGPNGSAAIIWDEKKIERLCRDFDLPSVLSVSSDQPFHLKTCHEDLLETRARKAQLED